MNKNFGPHSGQLVEILDQIMHINREMPSRRPTTHQQIREYLGHEVCYGKSNLRVLKIYRDGKPMSEKPAVKFQRVDVVEDQFNQKQCIGPYFINFGMNPT